MLLLVMQSTGSPLVQVGEVYANAWHISNYNTSFTYARQFSKDKHSRIAKHFVIIPAHANAAH